MKQTRNKLLAYLLIMLLTAACGGDYFCITNDPAQDLSASNTIVTATSRVINNTNTVTGPVISDNQYASDDILIKVSGSLNLCANDVNHPPKCNCPSTLPTPCVNSLENCNCTTLSNCQLGNSYPIPANLSSWTIVQPSALQGQTIQMTVPQTNYGGPTSSNCLPAGVSCGILNPPDFCGYVPPTEHYLSFIPCSTTGVCDIVRTCPTLTCNNTPQIPPGPNNGNPPTIPPATQTQGDCSGYTGGNRWSADNYTKTPYYDSNGNYPLNICKNPINNSININNSNMPVDPMGCWNVAAMGLMFQVTNPSGPNNINNWATDWNQSQTFVSGGVEAVPDSVPCPASSAAGAVGNYLTQVCFTPSPTETTSSAYTGVSDPSRITTQTIVINDPSQSTVSLRMYDIFYADNLGGYTVYVTSTCNVLNGASLNPSGIGQLQVQINNALVTLPSPIAHCSDLSKTPYYDPQYCLDSDITSGAAVYYHIASPPTGKVQFNITSSVPGGVTLIDSDISGALNITTYSQGQVGAFSTMIQDAINIIRNVLYGNSTATPPTMGVVQTLWSGNPNSDPPSKGIVGDGNYIEYLRVLLTLYIIFYGILFLLGTVQISQMDLMVRIIKIGVIVALTSDGSWSFFSNNLFNLFLNGSSELISLFTENFAGSSNNAFSFVDNVFQVLFFDYRTWLRVLALTLTSPLGFIYVLLILWGTLNYFLAIIEAVIAYIMSILSVSILLVLGPIFIPFILFSVTRELFNRWIQFLFSSAIKPVILLIGLNILSTMLLIVVLKLFSFPVCFGCAMPVFLGLLTDIVGAISSVINIGDFFFCLPWFKPWGFTNVGDGTSFSTATGLSISGILLFVMLTTFMKKLPDFVDDMTQRLAGTRGIALKVGGSKSIASAMMGAVGNKALGVVGMDAASRQRRKTRNTKDGPMDPKDKIGAKVHERK